MLNFLIIKYNQSLRSVSVFQNVLFTYYQVISLDLTLIVITITNLDKRSNFLKKFILGRKFLYFPSFAK